MDFQVNGVDVGSNGSELKLSAPTTVIVTLKAAAYLPEIPNEAIRGKPYDQKPYWDVERARIGPVDLDEVAGGVAEVHLCRPVRQFVHPREERVVVAKALLTGAPVDGVEVIDVQAHVMELRRLGVGADE